ncbi:hypothetical protein HK405_011914, partial [Cladochytrium tenue]
MAKIPNDASCVLITDVASDKVLASSRCTLEELHSIGIREMTSILTKRAARPKWFGVYFLTPMKDSVRRLIADFGRAGSPMYDGAFVFFTSPLRDKLFDNIKDSGIIQYVRELIELEIDFSPMESRFFHIGYDHAAQDLYGAQSPEDVEYILGRVAKKIRAVFATMNEDPLIRYHDPQNDGKTMSAILAHHLHKSMQELKSFDETFPTPTPFDDAGPATVIIVDRAIDIITPLLHSLSYECLIWELFEVKTVVERGLSQFIVEVQGETSEKQAIIDENNEIFASIRHLFITKAFEEVDRVLKEFQRQMESGGGDSGGGSMEKLRDAIMNLPENIRRKDQLDALVNLNVDLRDIVLLKRKLREVAEYEQTLAVGEDDDGSSPTSLRKGLEELLDDNFIQPEDKLRLLLLYIMVEDGLSPEDLEKLAERAGIEEDELAAVRGLSSLGVKLGVRRDVTRPDSPFTKQARRRALEAALEASGGSGGGGLTSIVGLSGVDLSGIFKHLNVGGSGGARGAVLDALAADGFLPATDVSSYDRFHPSVGYILQDHILGRLHSAGGGGGDMFPYVERPEARNRARGFESAVRADGSTARGQGVVVGLGDTTAAAGRFRWGRARPSPVGVEDFRFNGPRTILFIIGGASRAEIRAVHLVAKKLQREIYI